MFKPKITRQTIQDFIVESDDAVIVDQVNLKRTVVALPQLLDVLEAAREVPEVFEQVMSLHDDGSKTVRLSRYPKLQEAIKKLDEMHGVEDA